MSTFSAQDRRYVDSNAQSGDIAIVCADFMKELFDYYSEDRIATIGIKRTLGRNELATIIDPIIINHQRIWLILSHERGSPQEIYGK